MNIFFFKAIILSKILLLIGAIFMILVDDIARCAFTVEISLGIITGLVGGPFFLYLLFRGRMIDET